MLRTVMPETYRIYRLDRANHVMDVEWVNAADDDAAIAAARAMTHSGLREVWHGERLVASIRVISAEEPSAAFWL